MPDDFLTTIWLVVARAIHFGACLGLFGIIAFDRFIANRALKPDDLEAQREWNRIADVLLAIAIPAALLSGILWFAMLAVNLETGGRSIFTVMTIIWTRMHFGQVWKIRLVLWAAATIAILAQRSAAGPKAQLSWLTLLFSGALAVSLAWAGHGETGRAPAIHLTADLIHLFAAGLWPIGLLPFLMLFARLRRLRLEMGMPQLAALTRRFSNLSLLAVGLLVISGIVNSCCLMSSIGDLISKQYGRVLLLKITLFCVMVAIGAVNLLILKPRLTIPSSSTDLSRKSAAQLQWQVLAEIILGTIVIIVVAYLGLLPPSLE